ncbi:hypothetical protein ACS0TY_005615 [Phlomoides rotata]
MRLISLWQYAVKLMGEHLQQDPDDLRQDLDRHHLLSNPETRVLARVGAGADPDRYPRYPSPWMMTYR